MLVRNHPYDRPPCSARRRSSTAGMALRHSTIVRNQKAGETICGAASADGCTSNRPDAYTATRGHSSSSNSSGSTQTTLPRGRHRLVPARASQDRPALGRWAGPSRPRHGRPECHSAPRATTHPRRSRPSCRGTAYRNANSVGAAPLAASLLAQPATAPASSTPRAMSIGRAFIAAIQSRRRSAILRRVALASRCGRTHRRMPEWYGSAHECVQAPVLTTASARSAAMNPMAKLRPIRGDERRRDHHGEHEQHGRGVLARTARAGEHELVGTAPVEQEEQVQDQEHDCAGNEGQQAPEGRHHLCLRAELGSGHDRGIGSHATFWPASPSNGSLPRESR